jgi:membrane associated rhomboid family serine protease
MIACRGLMAANLAHRAGICGEKRSLAASVLIIRRIALPAGAKSIKVDSMKHQPESQSPLATRYAVLALRERLEWIAALLLSLWLVYCADWIVAPVGFASYGLTPRTVWGLLGIVTMPFLHRSLGHLLANTLALLVLLSWLALWYSEFRPIMVRLVLSSGCLLWIVGWPVPHIGAQSLAMAVLAFLFFSVPRRWPVMSRLAAISITVCYLLFILLGGITQAFQVDFWDGQLCGLAAGAFWGRRFSGLGQSERSKRSM